MYSTSSRTSLLPNRIWQRAVRVDQKMVKRNESILDILVLFPWWVSVILAGFAYGALNYLLPHLDLGNPLLNGLADQGPFLAPIVGLLLLGVAAVSAVNAWGRRRLLDRQRDTDTLRQLHWHDFERLVGEAYRRKGFTVVEKGGNSPDGGVDLVLRKNGQTFLVQCKHWKQMKVGVRVVRELFGVLTAEGAAGGVVITSGAFTQEARNFARGKALKLVDGKELQAMIAEVRREPVAARG